MSLAFLLKNLIGALLLPPGNGLLPLLLAGFFRRRRWAVGLAACGAALLLLQSLPVVSQSLMATLEDRAGLPPSEPGGAQAIVILGSGLTQAGPAFGGEMPSERTLIRVRHGARLARQWQLPVLVSGGRLPDAGRSEAAVMAEVLQDEFGVPVRWREESSLDTADNARLSAVLLREAGIRRVALVTQAFHMPRARLLFERAGLDVVPAPTHFVSKSGWPIDGWDFLPRASALHHSFYAEHEWLGLAWANMLAVH